MFKREHGEKLSKKLTQIAKKSHATKIVITDKNNHPLLRFPLALFIVITLIMPLVVGIFLFFFLLSELHAVFET